MTLEDYVEKCLKLLLTGMLAMLLIPVLPVERASASELTSFVSGEPHNLNSDVEVGLPESDFGLDPEDGGEGATYAADTTWFSGVCGTCQWSIFSEWRIDNFRGEIGFAACDISL